MAFRMSDKEWEDIKRKSTGDYSTSGSGSTSGTAEDIPMEEMPGYTSDDDVKWEKAWVKQGEVWKDRDEKKKARIKKQTEARKKRELIKSEKRIKRGIGKAVRNVQVALQPGTVPGYRSPNFNIAKSGYRPLDYKPVSGSTYKPVSDAPYYKPTNINPMGSGEYFEAKPYKPIFGGKVPMPKASKAKKSTKGRISPITGFRTF